MEIILIAVVVVIAGFAFYTWNKSKSFDLNNDGKVDAADVKAAVNVVVADVKSAADVNKDGKVDATDAKVVTQKAKTAVKKTVNKVKPKPNNRKPKPKSKA